MPEMVFLSRLLGSKVVVVAFPKCGRISRQILKEADSQQPVCDLFMEHKCPVCGTVYLTCSSANAYEWPNWSAAYDRYVRDRQEYNDFVKENYRQGLSAVHEQLKRAAQGALLNILRDRVSQMRTGKALVQETAMVQAPVRMDALDYKIELWKKQLLDLTKRNRMTNYRETKGSTLRILEPEFQELFNRLALEEEELIFRRPIDKGSDLRVFSIVSLLETLSYPLPVHTGDVRTEGTILERQKTLKNLRAKSKLAREEQGTNILYLSFGFIEWLENKEAGSSWLKSPLLMMPVSLKLESIHSFGPGRRPYRSNGIRKFFQTVTITVPCSYASEQNIPAFSKY